MKLKQKKCGEGTGIDREIVKIVKEEERKKNMVKELRERTVAERFTAQYPSLCKSC